MSPGLAPLVERAPGAEGGPRPTIITIDTAQDSAAGLYAVLASPEVFDVRAIIAQAGNVGVELTAPNTLKLLELAGRSDIPVFPGSAKPLAVDHVAATHVHGPTGLNGFDFPDPTTSLRSEDGVGEMIRLLRSAAAGEYLVLGLSPFTTIGAALLQSPDITAGIGEIVGFAGAFFERGNITPAAEFDAFVDPHALHIVLTSGVPVTLLSLDTSHQMLSTPERLQAFRETGTQCGNAVADLLGWSESFDLAKYGWPGAPLHGPVTPSYVIDPSIFEARRVSVRVELDSGPAFSTTSVDWWCVTGEEPNAVYVAGGDPDRYYTLLTHLYGRLP